MRYVWAECALRGLRRDLSKIINKKNNNKVIKMETIFLVEGGKIGKQYGIIVLDKNINQLNDFVGDICCTYS